MTTENLTFDQDQITPRMLVDFKRETGESLMGLLQADGGLDFEALAPEVLAGIIWIAMRMSGHPEATFDDALDTPLASLGGVEEAPEADPTNASTGPS